MRSDGDAVGFASFVQKIGTALNWMLPAPQNYMIRLTPFVGGGRPH